MIKGTTQGSVSGPHVFNLLINGLAIRDNELNASILVKYANDTTMLVKVCKNEINRSQEVANQFFS